MIRSIQQPNLLSYTPLLTEAKGLAQVVAGVAEILYSDCIKGKPAEIQRNQRSIVHFHNGRVNVKRGWALCFPGMTVAIEVAGCCCFFTYQWSVLSY